MTEMNAQGNMQEAPAVDPNAQAMPAAPMVNVNQAMPLQANTKQVNKHVFTWVGAWLFGAFGVDRFMRGQIGLGIFKLLIGSWITLGIWPLVDWIVAIVKSYGGAFGGTEDVVFINGKWAR
ncbi:MAG: TM2 domain-containing protein [Actinomycetaceae bacterium]|nr:TM2 domain-containing protein [Actinomycetaceae bacterium]